MLNVMARAVAKYVFAALLALLATPAAMPVVSLVPAAAVVWCCEVEQQKPIEAPRRTPDFQATPPAAVYESHISTAPAESALFQRPPPRSSRCS